MWNWYRYYDGEVSGGVAGHTLLKLLVTMARSATEAAKLLSLLHWSVVLGGSEDAVVAGGLSPRSRDVRSASRRLSGAEDTAPRADPTLPPRFQMDDPRIEALFTLEEVSDADASLLREMRSAARSVDDLRRSAGLPPLRAALRAATAMGRVDASPATDAAASSAASSPASPSATSQSVADRFILRPVGEDVFAWRPKRPTIDDSLWVTTAMLRRLLEASPEFLAEMERLRFDLVAPVHRAAVRRRQVEKELSKIEVHVVVIREKLQLARAAAFWTTRSSRKWFTLWVAHVKEKKEVESRMMIQRIRRLLRLWVEASHARRVARSQRKVADLFFMRSREVRAFRAWLAFTSTRLRRRVVYERRADQAYRLSVLENGWEQLFTATIGAKGLRLRRNNLLRFAFRGWKRFLELAQCVRPLPSSEHEKGKGGRLRGSHLRVPLFQCACAGRWASRSANSGWPRNGPSRSVRSRPRTRRGSKARLGTGSTRWSSRCSRTRPHSAPRKVRGVERGFACSGIKGGRGGRIELGTVPAVAQWRSWHACRLRRTGGGKKRPCRARKRRTSASPCERRVDGSASSKSSGRGT